MQFKKNNYDFFKESFDKFYAFILLILLLPLILLTAFLILIKLGKPIIFLQDRAGLNGKPFRLFKFRSMTNEYNFDGKLLPPEERLTKFGIFLRSTSLDEIPSLINVLKGDMSFIGPRPLPLDYVPLYSKEQRLRLCVKPGISGLAQVKGRNAISWDQRFSLDIKYVRSKSLVLDCKIFLNTILTVCARKGVTPKNKLIMDAFTGEKNLN
mgnify:CR=1 FL=1|tara:strand:+ start:970 stop:1599 length:630 start_codon:yes stop_codon:yes gene_type:complete